MRTNKTKKRQVYKGTIKKGNKKKCKSSRCNTKKCKSTRCNKKGGSSNENVYYLKHPREEGPGSLPYLLITKSKLNKIIRKLRRQNASWGFHNRNKEEKDEPSLRSNLGYLKYKIDISPWKGILQGYRQKNEEHEYIQNHLHNQQNPVYQQIFEPTFESVPIVNKVNIKDLWNKKLKKTVSGTGYIIDGPINPRNKLFTLKNVAGKYQQVIEDSELLWKVKIDGIKQPIEVSAKDMTGTPAKFQQYNEAQPSKFNLWGLAKKRRKLAARVGDAVVLPPRSRSIRLSRQRSSSRSRSR